MNAVDMTGYFIAIVSRVINKIVFIMGGYKGVNALIVFSRFYKMAHPDLFRTRKSFLIEIDGDLLSNSLGAKNRA